MPRTPAGLPVLSRGKHRSPRRGACLMEYASLLAGERWSDAPRCTHPALGTLARGVNDCIGDQARQELLGLVPQIIGAVGPADPQLGARLARKAALHALRVATGVRRRTVYVALLAAELSCGQHSADDVDHQAVRELLRDPDDDLRAATCFLAHRPARSTDERAAVTNALHLSISTIADMGGARADEMLRDLLVEAVATVRAEPVLAASRR